MNRSDSLRQDRSFDSVFNKLMRMKSENHESFKTAMYNLLIASGVVAFVAVCIILGPFVRPLFWAFIMGAFLFPFKRKLAHLLNFWFNRLEENDSNIFVAICFAPFETTEYFGRILSNSVKEHWQIITAGMGIAVCIKFLSLYAPKGFFFAVWKTSLFGFSVFAYLVSFINIYLVSLIIFSY